MLPNPFLYQSTPSFYYYSPNQTIINQPHYIIIPLNNQTITTITHPQPISMPPIGLPSTNQENNPENAKIRQKRSKNAKKQRISARKNSESNIINHYFSYFTTKQSSQATITKIAFSLNLTDKSQKLIGCLYSAIRLINIKRGKNYINKSILNAYFTVEGLGQSIPEFIQKLHSSSICSAQQLSEMLRKSFYYFLREPCYCCILTSKRISLLSKEAHLEKLRKMLKYVKRKEDFD